MKRIEMRIRQLEGRRGDSLPRRAQDLTDAELLAIASKGLEDARRLELATGKDGGQIRLAADLSDDELAAIAAGKI